MLTRPERLNGLHPALVAFAKRVAEEAMSRWQRNVQIAWGYRSPAEQDRLYAQGRTAPGQVVTNARGGQSPHQHRAAIDLYPWTEDKKAIDWNFDEFYEMMNEVQRKEFPELRRYKWDRPHTEVREWKLIASGDKKIKGYRPSHA